MSDNDKPTPPGGANQLIDLGPCGDSGTHHMLACKDGVPVAATHFRPVEDGKPLPPDCDLYYVDRRTGQIVDSMRVGSGPAQVATKQYRDNWDATFGNNEELN